MEVSIRVYSETSIMWTPLGPAQSVLIIEVSLFQRVPMYECLWKCVWDCKKVFALERCLLREVSLYYKYINFKAGLIILL